MIDRTADGLKVSSTWPVTAAEKNFPMTLDAASSRLFVVCRKPACVLIYDTRTGKMLSSSPCVGDSDDVFYDFKRRQLYVIGGEGFVDVFRDPENADNNELTRIARVPTAPKARTGFFIPDLGLIAVTVPHSVDHPCAVMLFRTNRVK